MLNFKITRGIIKQLLKSEQKSGKMYSKMMLTENRDNSITRQITLAGLHLRAKLKVLLLQSRAEQSALIFDFIFVQKHILKPEERNQVQIPERRI